MRNVSNRSCGDNQNTYFVISNSPGPRNGAVDEIMWTNMVQSDRPQMTI